MLIEQFEGFQVLSFNNVMTTLFKIVEIGDYKFLVYTFDDGTDNVWILSEKQISEGILSKDNRTLSIKHDDLTIKIKAFVQYSFWT